MHPSSDRTPFRSTRDADAARTIAESLQRLEGVQQARLEPPDAAEPERVHVVVAPEWRPETVRRDVQALLLHRHGLNLDGTRVVISSSSAPETPSATEAPPPPVAPAPQAVGRPVLDAVHLALRSRGTSVGVELVAGDRRLRGSAGPVGPTSVLTAVAQAAVRALEDGLPHSVEVDVAEVVEVGGDRIAMATVVASDDRSRQRLTGSTLVRGNVEDAMARAVLDATNRLWRVGSRSAAAGRS